jgi:signal peptidase I
MSSLVKRALEGLLAVYVVAVGALAIAVQLSPAAGVGLYGVRTGSMVPALRPGDLVAVERVAAAEVRSGDVITVALASGATVTHRVVAVVDTPAGLTFITQGDANDHADPVAVGAGQVVGRAAWRLPVAGTLLALLSALPGLLGLLTIAASLVVAIAVVDGRELDATERGLRDELARLRPRVRPDGLTGLT